MLKTKKTRYHRGTRIDEIIGIQYFENKPEVAFFKCIMRDGCVDYIMPDSIEETKEGDLYKAIQEVCEHRHRSPVSENGHNLIVCTVCNKSWKEGELCKWRKK